jgi:hypothetical protein
MYLADVCLKPIASDLHGAPRTANESPRPGGPSVTKDPRGFRWLVRRYDERRPDGAGCDRRPAAPYRVCRADDAGAKTPGTIGVGALAATRSPG